MLSHIAMQNNIETESVQLLLFDEIMPEVVTCELGTDCEISTIISLALSYKEVKK